MVTINTGETFAGPLRAFINGASVGVTEGPATITVEQETTPIHTNEFGVVDSVVIDNGATVTFSLAQLDPDAVLLANPGAEVVTSGSRQALYQNSTRGLSLLSTAGTLVLSGTNGTTSQQWTFKKAFVEEGHEIEYGDEQVTIELTYRAVPDPSNPGGVDSLFKYETFPT